MKYMYRLLALASFILATQGCQNTDFTAVTIQQGEVIGQANQETISFKGIPYAAPPVKSLRWRAPQPPAAFSQPLRANHFANQCIQRPLPHKPKDPHSESQSEDCLYLNIYRPNNTQHNLPVMVWIPGGGLFNGSGGLPAYHGKNLAMTGVIVVTINYRLGAFGFFAHPALSKENADNGRLYNYGLMDQIAALQWIQQNITQFGGNQNNVTVFGESAGAYSIDALIASQPKTELFHKAIVQSGYGRGAQPHVKKLTSSDNEPAIEASGIALAERLGNRNMSLESLRTTPAEDIVKATDFANFIQFAVDGALLTDNIETLFKMGKQAAIPLLIGANDFEFGMVPAQAQRDIMSALLPDGAMEALSEDYQGEKNRDTMLYSDYVFHSQARRLAQYHEAAGNPVYVYRFAMPAKQYTSFPYAGDKVWGAPHAGEIPYVFGNFTGEHGEPTQPNETQSAMAKQMTLYWSNFAKTGSPNGNELPHWPRYQDEMLMHFSPNGTKAIEDNWISRLDALNQYFPF